MAGFNPITGVRRRYAVKLVLLLLAVAVLVGGFGYLIYAQTGATLQDDTEADLEHATELQASSIEERLAANQRQTAMLSQTAVLQSGEQAQIQQFIDGQIQTMDEAVLGIHYIDATSETIEASTIDGATGSAEDMSWITDGFGDGQPVLAGPYEDPDTNTHTGVIVMDVDESHRVAVLFDMAAISSDVSTGSDVDASTLVITESENKVVISDTEESLGKIDPRFDDVSFDDGSGYAELDLDEADSTGATGDEIVDFDQTEGTMAIGYATLMGTDPGTDWIVMTHEPKSQAFALQSDITRSLAALVAVAFLGLGLIGLVVGRNTSGSLRRLASKARELESGNLETELESGRVDEIGQLYDAFDSMRHSLADSIEQAESARERAEDRGAELEELATHLQAKAESFHDVMEDAADGDMTARMDTESEHEAMEAIADEYNQMMDEIAATTDELKRFAEEVAAHSQQVTASAQEVQTASSKVTNSVQEISTSTDEQYETFQTVSTEMDDLAATTEEIASLSDDVSRIAERTAEAGEQGQSAAESAIEAIDDIDEDAANAVAEIEQLQNQIDEIEEITDFIQEVAKQTNMLALNANIEASRSGDETDEGFSAVAEEVKDLAVDVQDSAEEIDTLVQKIQTQGSRTASEVRETRNAVARNADAVSEAVAALDDIAEYAAETHDGTEEISAASQQQASSIQDVVSLVADAEAESERVSTEASTAAAAAAEQTTALSEVTESASDLAQRSGTLQERLDEFDTPGDTATPQQVDADD